MINIKTLAMATAVSAGIAFAVPVASQAMPAGPVKIQATTDSNIVDVRHKKKKWRESRRWRDGRRWRESRRWRHNNRRWGRYCDPWDGCYRRRHARFYRYYDEPYYGGYYGPGFYGPGIGLQFRID